MYYTLHWVKGLLNAHSLFFFFLTLLHSVFTIPLSSVFGWHRSVLLSPYGPFLSHNHIPPYPNKALSPACLSTRRLRHDLIGFIKAKTLTLFRSANLSNHENLILIFEILIFMEYCSVYYTLNIRVYIFKNIKTWTALVIKKINTNSPLLH